MQASFNYFTPVQEFFSLIRSRDHNFPLSCYLDDLFRTDIEAVGSPVFLEIQEPPWMNDHVGIKVQKIRKGIGDDLKSPGQTAQETLQYQQN
jgi:hypothetical protein